MFHFYNSYPAQFVEHQDQVMAEHYCILEATYHFFLQIL